MNTFLKSTLLSISLLYSMTAPIQLEAKEHSTAGTIITACVTVAAGVAAIVGLSKFFSWAYYYKIDHTPVQTFMMEFSNKTKFQGAPYLNDYETYLNGIALSLIINGRYPNFEYPTLTYYDALQKISNDLYYLKEAFERKKSKNKDIQQIYTIDDYIIQITLLKEQIDSFKKIISQSPAYSVEYRAKYPPAPKTNVIIIHHYDTQK